MRRLIAAGLELLALWLAPELEADVGRWSVVYSTGGYDMLGARGNAYDLGDWSTRAEAERAFDGAGRERLEREGRGYLYLTDPHGRAVREVRWEHRAALVFSRN